MMASMMVGWISHGRASNGKEYRRRCSKLEESRMAWVFGREKYGMQKWVRSMVLGGRRPGSGIGK
jgi:hypothetical protein